MTQRKRTLRRRPDPNAPIRAIVYTRLSRAKTGATRDTAERNTEVSHQTQQAGCERAIAALGGDVVGVERDTVPGDRLDRPGLWQAIERIESGEANTLIVYALDRFGREQDQQGVAVIALKRAGGRLLSATENVEDGPIGDFMRAAIGLAGALELAKIRERTTRAFDAKFRQTQKYKPSWRPPYGYRKIGTGADATYEIDPAESAIVRRIFSERAAGASLRKLAVRLNADEVPTPEDRGVWGRGRGRWGNSTLNRILHRPVYWTGEHQCWVTEVVRDGDNIPFQAERPADERYTVEFPSIIEPALAERAAATDERNVWSTARDDRPTEFAIGRFGFFRCASCGRALTVNSRGNGKGRPAYSCAGHRNVEHVCGAPATISVDKLDGPVWWWVQAIIEDPNRAEAWRVVTKPARADEAMVEALALLEADVAQQEAEVATLFDNLGRLTGAAAQMAAERLNILSEALEHAREVRDLAAKATAAVAACNLTPERRLEPADALAAVTLTAVEAMRQADPHPERTHEIVVITPSGREVITLSDSWKARRAALTVFGVTVHVQQEALPGPRWTAEMRLADGTALSGSWPKCLSERAYMNHSSP